MPYKHMRSYENLQKAYYDGVGQYGIPELKATQFDGICEFIGFNYAANCSSRADKGIHFFLDDYQFMRVWSFAERYIDMLKQFKYVMSPDFSLYTDYPKVLQLYNHYRKHWLGRYWQDNEIRVIPTVCWSDESSFEWCFDGEPVKSVVAVSSVGCRMNKEYLKLFVAGYNEMLARLNPEQIIFHGKIPEGCQGNIIPISVFTEKWRGHKNMDLRLQFFGGRGGGSGLNGEKDKEKLFDWLEKEGTAPGTPVPIDINEFQGQTLEQIERRLRNLEHEELFVFDKDGKIIEAYRGNKNSVCFRGEVIDYQGVTVTHGHPKAAANFGGTFSFADMKNMLKSKWAEHRATASGQGEMNYILRKTGNANPQGFYDQINRDYTRLKETMSDTWDISYHGAVKEGKSTKIARHEARQKTVGVLNKYYKETAPKFGYEYITRKTEYEYNR